MTDTKRLRERIESRGLKYRYVATELGLTPYGLSRKIENDSEFKVSEVNALSKILGLTMQEKDEIFFYAVG